MLYVSLFLSFVKVGFLGFGGGMAIISLIQEEVLAHGWMSETEFVDIVAVSQMTPGPVGMNCATYVGYTATGTVFGSLLASFAVILPSLIVMLTVCAVYDRLSRRWSENRIYKAVMRLVRIAVVLLVAHAAWTLVTPATFIDRWSILIFSLALLCMLLPDMFRLAGQPRMASHPVTRLLSHPVFLMAAAALSGSLLYG